ncbi:MAG TPA: hypothetical protein VMV21_00180 [Vicinamibacteria bacterium]|nr:hypothetical protein [Vicinamibacteria bacterium]
MTRADFLRRVSSGVLWAWFLPALVPAVATAQEPPPRPFLRKVIQLDDAQLAAIEKGEVVTKLLPTTDKPEIAAFGVVKTGGTPDQLVALARDVRRFKKVPQIPEMGLFSTPAKIEDLADLTHPPDDIAALKRCKQGSCDVKIGTTGLDRISRIDWKAADAEKQAIAIFNQAIVDYVTAYEQGGTDAMGNVLDKKQEKSRAQEYRTLLANSPYLVDYVKEFNDYLAAWPKGKLAGAEDVLYWAKDTFGLKPVVSAYHATIYKSSRGALIANKLLGASHFFNASLEILAAVPTADGKGLYLLNLYRTRIDPPTGMLGGVLMGKVRSGIETGVNENLKMARERLAAAR